jgi:hypothetical protein
MFQSSLLGGSLLINDRLFILQISYQTFDFFFGTVFFLLWALSELTCSPWIHDNRQQLVVVVGSVYLSQIIVDCFGRTAGDPDVKAIEFYFLFMSGIILTHPLYHGKNFFCVPCGINQCPESSFRVAFAGKDIIIQLESTGESSFYGKDSKIHFCYQELNHPVLGSRETTVTMCSFSEGDYTCISDYGLERLHVIEARTGFNGIQMNGIVFEPGMQFGRLFCRELRWPGKVWYE